MAPPDRSPLPVPSGSKGLIAIAAAATRRLLAEVIGAENFAIDVGAGEGVARHQFVRIGEAVRELEGGLGGDGLGGEESFGDGTDGGARVDGQGERGVDAGADGGAGNFGELLAVFALAFDGRSAADH